MRTLAITQNITVDGSIEMLGDWFDPQGQGDTDNSDLLGELHRQDRDADGLLVAAGPFRTCAATGLNSPTTPPALLPTSTRSRSTWSPRPWRNRTGRTPRSSRATSQIRSRRTC